MSQSIDKIRATLLQTSPRVVSSSSVPRGMWIGASQALSRKPSTSRAVRGPQGCSGLKGNPPVMADVSCCGEIVIGQEKGFFAEQLGR
jgi:hypothetical protein